MPQPRKQLISLSDTPYYHCVSRCVRRAYLCGKDKVSGKSYEHRRGWVEKRILFLSNIFCIDVCAYAVMSNHTHLVLFVDVAGVQKLRGKDILARWQQLFKLPPLAKKALDQESVDTLGTGERESICRLVELFRSRLKSISWFMRCLNEFIAIQANREDECTGHFWEGRFKSQALIGEASVAACMAYVDLNPVRANIASSPDTSHFTSIKRHLTALKSGQCEDNLKPFVDMAARGRSTLPFDFKEYLALLDLTINAQKSNEHEFQCEHELPLLDRLGVKSYQWINLTRNLEVTFSAAIGSEASLKAFCRNTHRHHINGIAVSRMWLQH